MQPSPTTRCAAALRDLEQSRAPKTRTLYVNSRQTAQHSLVVNTIIKECIHGTDVTVTSATGWAAREVPRSLSWMCPSYQKPMLKEYCNRLQYITSDFTCFWLGKTSFLQNRTSETQKSHAKRSELRNVTCLNQNWKTIICPEPLTGTLDILLYFQGH